MVYVRGHNRNVKTKTTFIDTKARIYKHGVPSYFGNTTYKIYDVKRSIPDAKKEVIRLKREYGVTYLDIVRSREVYGTKTPIRGWVIIASR